MRNTEIDLIHQDRMVSLQRNNRTARGDHQDKYYQKVKFLSLVKNFRIPKFNIIIRIDN